MKKTITLIRKVAFLLLCNLGIFSGYAQVPISGIVTDETNGEAVPGVSIIAKGTNIGTTTDIDGKYSLNIPDNVNTLVFSFIGYATTEVDINNRTTINVVLPTSTETLEEVVIIGYGKQKKENLTGAVSAVEMGEVLGNRPVINTATALQGAIPGLQITSGTGQPGGATFINVRGIESINGGSPLVLVDNVEMDINDVNPRDIESVSVLKDAAASSIYGARAAFGVILITTKKGNKNHPVKFNYTSNIAFTTPSTLPEKASPMEFVSAMNDFGNLSYWTGNDIQTWLGLLEEYQQNPGAYPTGSTEVDGLVYHLAEQNIYDELLPGGFEQLHNFSFSGGSENSTYRASVGFADQDGLMITEKDSYRKYNFSGSFRTDLTSKLTAGINMFYKNDLRSDPQVGFGVNLASFTPFGYAEVPGGDRLPYDTPNNIAEIEPADRFFGDNLRISGILDFRPVEGLKITGKYSFNKINTNSRLTVASNEYINEIKNRYFRNEVTSYARNTWDTDYHVLNLYANYEKSFGDHNFNFLLGTNQEKRSLESFNIKRLDLIAAEIPSISTSTGEISGGDSFGEYAISGYFGRVNYNYREKYLLELNGRLDGSSRFADGQRFGFFPSASAGWVLSEESFMEPIKEVVDFFKIRASYGEIGNQVTPGFYPYIPSLSTYYGEWVDPNSNLRYLTMNPPALVRTDFTWETVRTANVGVDIGLFNGRLNTSFDVFNRQTLGMLAPGAELPSVLGAPAPFQNVADLESKGWELEMSWQDKVNDFRYSFGFNLSDNRGYITDYDNPAGLISQYYIGQEIGEIWGYETQGFFTVDDFVEGTLNDDLTGGELKEGIAPHEGVSQNPGDNRYVDLNDDGVINQGQRTLDDPGDRKIIGNSHRRYQFGIFGNASFKNFTLSFFLQGVGKRDLWISNNMYWPYQSEFATIYKHQLDYWTPENTDAFYQRNYPSANTGQFGRSPQTKHLSNGAYLRVKSITLGYTLPKKILDPVFIDNVNIFFSGENLFNFTHLPKGMDPESSDQGGGGIYPFPKKFSFGLNLTF